MKEWQSISEQLSEKNGSGSLVIYLHISRGADTKRFHAFPEGVEPTVFSMAFKIPQLEGSDLNHIEGYALASEQKPALLMFLLLRMKLLPHQFKITRSNLGLRDVYYWMYCEKTVLLK